MKENIIIQDVYLLEVKALDFKDNDGKKICGYSVFYYRDFSDREKDSNSCGKKVEKIFIVKDSIEQAKLFTELNKDDILLITGGFTLGEETVPTNFMKIEKI